MGHSHSPAHGSVHGQEKNILLAFSLNLGFALLEFVGGFLTNSVAIISDALHDIGDSVALLFSYYAQRVSEKEPDRAFTYGYRRFALVSALLNGLILIAGSIFVIKEAVERIQNPETVRPEGMFILALLGIAANSFAAWKLQGGKGLNINIIKYHLLEDILGWVAVLIVSVVLIFRPWYILDSILSVLISFIILRGAFKNLYRVGKIFVQKFPENIQREEIVDEIKNLDKVHDIHLLQGWSLDEETLNITLHVKVSPEMKILEADRLRHKIENLLRKAGVEYFTIQIESDEHCVKGAT